MPCARTHTKRTGILVATSFLGARRLRTLTLLMRPYPS